MLHHPALRLKRTAILSGMGVFRSLLQSASVPYQRHTAPEQSGAVCATTGHPRPVRIELFRTDAPETKDDGEVLAIDPSVFIDVRLRVVG